MGKNNTISITENEGSGKPHGHEESKQVRGSRRLSRPAVDRMNLPTTLACLLCVAHLLRALVPTLLSTSTGMESTSLKLCISLIHKGYRCLEPTTKRVYISRHVVFDEVTFPYKPTQVISKDSHLEVSEFPNFDEWIGDSQSSTKNLDSSTHSNHSNIESSEIEKSQFDRDCYDTNIVVDADPNLADSRPSNQANIESSVIENSHSLDSYDININADIDPNLADSFSSTQDLSTLEEQQEGIDEPIAPTLTVVAAS
ncbi:hypothetical protein LWI28_023054 [Acer negundo]|uniref:Retroviral polymerase SH3-like domain-containing protein n=1 Tax=Acer negundo TaxID=4023 RepID=A0AAD5NEK6_ACENE|nr:hypothetical protein LWI28_023054 [Acer negundo]